MLCEYPLTKANRIRLAQAFRNVPRVDLSIDCVLEDQMGQAYVDDLLNPTVFKIQSGPFFYLAGDADCVAAETVLRSIQTYTLFMPSSPGWLDAMKAMYGDRLQAMQRYSFSAEQLDGDYLMRLWRESDLCGRIQQMNEAFAERVWDEEHFIDLSDYDSPTDFGQRGIGFYLACEDEAVGAVFGSLVCSKGIEISAYVRDSFRRKGVATALSARLLCWCLEQGVGPHWDAGNPVSCKLARKLGYVESGNYMAHYLADAR